MARRGRPKKENAVRKPCGESTGEEIIPPPFNMTGIAEKEVVHEGKILQLRKRVSELERLYDEGRIRERQRIAGERYADLVRRYRIHILGAPSPEAKVSQPEGPRGYDDVDMELLDIERQKAIQEDNERLRKCYDGAWLCLVDRFDGISIKRAVDNLCLRDDSSSLSAARIGLNLLADYFGLEGVRRP